MPYAQAPIGDHAAIGDGRSIALITTSGAIDWLCWPRFDSPAIFAGLLDAERGGSWRIAPTGPARASRRYLPDTNVLETRFACATGTLVVTDAMTIAEASPTRGAPRNEHELVRRLVCERGHVEVEVVFEPRPDFGRARLRLVDRGALGLRCEVGAHLFALHGVRALTVDATRAHARFVLAAGDRATFALTYDEEIATLPVLGTAADARLAATAGWWRGWLASLRYAGPDRDAVARSALAVKLLAFAPSGAVTAAATTSLPEKLGADLNWDYRYCWLRDAAFTARAYAELGFAADADAFCSWLLHATRLTRPELRILYDVYGNLPADEEILPAFAGHRGSRPVRLNNAAADQLQLDCYGEVLDAATQLHARAGLDHETQHLLEGLGRFVLAHWREPDHGIWEARGEPRHRTHSRALCWVALDRLLALRARDLVRGLPVAHLQTVRAEIEADLQRHAWNPRIESYVDCYGSDEVDATLLLLPWYGVEDARSPRMCATYARIEARLRAGPGLFWRNERARAVAEGAFGICSAWAVDYLTRAGRLEDARRELDAFLAYGNDVGLFAEEIDPRDGAALGNFPQAYTHVGLINAALGLAAAAPGVRARAGGTR